MNISRNKAVQETSRAALPKRPYGRIIKFARTSGMAFASIAIVVTFITVVVQHRAYAYVAPTVPVNVQQNLETYDSSPGSSCNQAPYYFQDFEPWAAPTSGQPIVVNSGSAAPTVSLNFYSLEFGCHYATVNYSPAQALTAANYPDDAPMAVEDPGTPLPNAPIKGDYLAANTSTYVNSASVTGNTGSPALPGSVSGLDGSDTNIPFQAGTRYWYPSGNVPQFNYIPSPAAPPVTQDEVITVQIIETPVSTFTYGGNTYYRCVEGDYPATTGDAATAEYRTIYGVLVPCPTKPINVSFTIFVAGGGSGPTCPTGESGTYPNCVNANPTGSATCSTPSFNPARLPWDPGEHVGVTVAVNYTPASGSTGNAANDATYTTYQQGGAPPPTLTITSPGWGWAPQNAPPETSLTATATVPNTTGPFEVEWTFSWSVQVTTYTWNPATNSYAAPIGSTVAEQQQCVYPASTQGNGQACTVTPTNPCTPPNTNLCTSATPCSQSVEDYPYFRVYGGDVSAGGTCSNGQGGIYGWPTEEYGVNAATWVGGAGTQFAEAALGLIDGAASAANVGSAASGPQTGLSFANQSVDVLNDNYGGCSGGVDGITSAAIAKNYQAPTGAKTFISQDTLTGDNGVYYGGNNTPISIGSTSGNTESDITSGERIVLYVNGDVVINQNIVFQGPWANTNAIPTLEIIASGDIDIAPSVTQLDGVYIAAGANGSGGNINTCNNVGGQTDPNYDTACDTRLVVNGSLVAANNVYLNRTFGTVSQSSTTDSGDNAAEVINYNPLLFLSTQTQLSPNYSAISTLPPVL